MGTRIYTETTCQGCGKVDKREGQWEGVPPVAWLSGDFQIADEPTVDGRYQAKQEGSIDALCVSCGDKVLAVLGVKRKRQRKTPVEMKDSFATTTSPPGRAITEQDIREARNHLGKLTEPIYCDQGECLLPWGHIGSHMTEQDILLAADLDAAKSSDTHEQPEVGLYRGVPVYASENMRADRGRGVQVVEAQSEQASGTAAIPPPAEEGGSGGVPALHTKCRLHKKGLGCTKTNGWDGPFG